LQLEKIIETKGGLEKVDFGEIKSFEFEDKKLNLHKILHELVLNSSDNKNIQLHFKFLKY